MERVAIIYALIDPRDATIQYVGWTLKPMRERLGCHCSEARAGGKTRRNRWVRSLLAIELRPTIWTIEVTSDYLQRERYWIAHYRAAGCNLLNGTDGGEGGAPWSKETRAKHMAMWTPEMREIYRQRVVHLHKPEVIRRRAATMTGKRFGPHTEEHKAKIAASTRIAKLGKKRGPLSAEWRAKIGAAMTGRQFSAESLAKIAASNRARGRLTEEQANDIRCLANLMSGPAVARMYQVAHGMIYRIWHGQSW